MDPKDPYLTNELLNEFIENGYSATVFAIGDITGSSQNIKLDTESKEYLFPTSGNKKYLKYFFSWPKIFIAALKEIRKKKEYDICIVYAPLSLLFPITLMLNIFKIKKRVCIIFDIFPIHQIQIGAINKHLGNIFRLIEKRLLSKFNLISGMSPENVKHIKNYYKINDKKIVYKTIHLWGVKDNPIVAKPVLNSNEIRVVFGGQIIQGRSVDQLIDLILKIRKSGLPISLTIFSQGAGFELLKTKYSDVNNVIIFKKRLQREMYLKTISSYDVGAIITDSRVTLPTFPSKIIDYINCELPCICLIETNSDIENIIGIPSFLHVNHFDFSSDSIEDISIFLKNAKNYHHTNFEDFILKFGVHEAANKIISSLH